MVLNQLDKGLKKSIRTNVRTYSKKKCLQAKKNIEFGLVLKK